MEMGIHRDSDKCWDEVFVWCPSVRKPQLDENYLNDGRQCLLTMKINTNIVIQISAQEIQTLSCLEISLLAM